MNKIFKVIWNPATGVTALPAKRRRAVAKRADAVTVNFCAGCGWAVVVVWGKCSVSLDGGTSTETPQIGDNWIA